MLDVNSSQALVAELKVLNKGTKVRGLMIVNSIIFNMEHGKTKQHMFSNQVFCDEVYSEVLSGWGVIANYPVIARWFIRNELAGRAWHINEKVTI